MAIILIVEHDEKMRSELRRLATPHQLVCVDSAAKAWSLAEAGFTFDEVIYFADSVAEMLLRATLVDPEGDLSATELAIDAARAA